MEIDTKLKNNIIKKGQIVKKAFFLIEKAEDKIIFVIDDMGCPVGSITDGDLRRAMIKNISLDSSVENVMKKNPILVDIDLSINELKKAFIENKVLYLALVNKKGQLKKIESYRSLFQKKLIENNVLIMAGGKGKRLLPLTKDNPKPMLKIGGLPLLETTIRNIARLGFYNITISLNYKGSHIEKYFKDGSDYGVSITYIKEEKELGTAGALSIFHPSNNLPFIVMNGDILTTLNFKKIVNFHNLNNAFSTMTVRSIDFEIPYGVVKLKNTKNIKNIIEKPTFNYLINSGIYVFDNKVLNIIPKNKKFDIISLFEKLKKLRKKNIIYMNTDYWIDIGQVKDYNKANFEFKNIFNN